MAKTSVNVQPCKVQSAERHNGRHKELSYLIPNPNRANESWISDRLRTHGTLVRYHAALAKMVKEKTGRTMQAKATPIREAVVVIKENTTMAELRQLATKFEEAWGIKCLRIDTHFDEGYPRKVEEGKRNLHAHMIFDYQDWDTGKSIKLANIPAVDEAGKPILDEKGKQVTVKPTTLMQDMAAECLGMDRGQASDKKHLSAMQYKVQAEQERAEQLQEQVADLSAAKAAKEVTIDTIKATGEWLTDRINGNKKALQERIKQLEEELPIEREKGRSEGRKSTLQAIVDAARLKIEHLTPENIGKRWRMWFDKVESLEQEVRQLKEAAEEQEKAAKWAKIEYGNEKYREGIKGSQTRIKGLEADVAELIRDYAHDNPDVVRHYSEPREGRLFMSPKEQERQEQKKKSLPRPVESPVRQEKKQQEIRRGMKR